MVGEEVGLCLQSGVEGARDRQVGEGDRSLMQVGVGQVGKVVREGDPEHWVLLPVQGLAGLVQVQVESVQGQDLI